MASRAVKLELDQELEGELWARRSDFASTYVRYLVIGGASATLVSVVAALLIREANQLRWLAAIVGLITALALAYTPLARRGYRRLAGGLVLGSLQLGAALALIVLPEAGYAVVGALVICVFMSGTFFGRMAGPLSAVSGAILLGVGLVLVRTASPRWFPAFLPPTVSVTMTVFLSIVSFAAVCAMAGRTLVEQEGYFVDSRKATRALNARVEGEEAQRGRLEQTIAKYVNHMHQVGEGNLAVRLQVDGNGEDRLAALGRSLNATVESLQRMTARTQEAAAALSAASVEILTSTTQQASGASEQSAAISQTTTVVDEVKTIAEQVSHRAQEVATASQRTVEVSQSGQRAVQATIESMEGIKERVEGIAENILALSEQTQQIGEIIATVNDIAAQSNILALNASVEAARAGEHGRGFAVVAVEVRNLAEQSRAATRQVRGILEEIQKATNATVMATEEGTKQVDVGVQTAAQARTSIEQLSRVIAESAQAATQMVAGGRQQVTGVEQVALAMRNINQATVQNLASTRQAEKSAQNLSELAAGLDQIVKQYRL